MESPWGPKSPVSENFPQCFSDHKQMTTEVLRRKETTVLYELPLPLHAKRGTRKCVKIKQTKGRRKEISVLEATCIKQSAVVSQLTARTDIFRFC